MGRGDSRHKLSFSAGTNPRGRAFVLVKPPPELEQNPDVLWKLRKALYGLKTSPKLWQQHLSSKLEELGLRKNRADPCIFMGEKLLVMTYVDDLLIVGEKQAQESFLAKLSAQFPLKHQTKLDAKTPLTFLGKISGVQCTRTQHQLVSSSSLLPQAFQDVWNGTCQTINNNRGQAWSV